MPTLAPERSVDEVIAGWRRGLAEDGVESPAGPLYPSGAFAEYEITLTGGGETYTCTMMQSCIITGWGAALRLDERKDAPKMLTVCCTNPGN